MRLSWLVVCVAVGAVAQAPVHPAYPVEGPLAMQVQAITSSVGRAHWGVAVTAMDGTPLFGLREGEFFRPASNAKLYTTAAAMALLGPERMFKTTIMGTVDAKGTVTGNLTLVGGGDANFGSAHLPYVSPAQRVAGAVSSPALADLRAMVAQLVAKGVKRVNGNVVGDDRLFPYEPFAGSWDMDDLIWGYGAPVSALTVNDNEMLLTIAPGTATAGQEARAKATVTLEQNGVAYYTVRNDVVMMKAGTGSDVNVDRMPGSRMIRVYGHMAVDAKVDTEHVAVDEPALYAAMALRGMLLEAGIVVKGEAVVQHAEVNHMWVEDGKREERMVAGGDNGVSCMAVSNGDKVLAEHTSAPLAADVLFTNKVSQNLHAELLLHQLGHALTCSDGSTDAGERMLRAFAKHAGLDGEDFLFYDGSGLSGHDLVTPRATASLLAYAAGQPWFAAWKDSLPVGGEDGSLAGRFGKSSLKGKLFAKTGTLGESRALSGYVEGASGTMVIFSVMVDTHAPGGAADRVAMDKVVEAVAAAF